MKLERRDVLKLAAGAALGRPLAARAEGLALAAPAAAAPAAGRFFSGPELSLLDELTALVIPADEHSPGAREAGVAAFLDGRLAEKDPRTPDHAEEGRAWREGLQAIDGLCRELKGKAFLEASAAERLAVLGQAAAAEADPKTPAEHFFVRLKDATAQAYYTSKIGIHQELEYKGNVLLMEFVGEDAK